MKNHKRILLLLLALVIAISSVALVGCKTDKKSSGKADASQSASAAATASQSAGQSESSSAATQIKFYFEADGSKLHTDTQLAYLADEYYNVANYADGHSEKSKPMPALIKWQTNGKASDCELYISDDETFANYRTISATGNSAEIYNLKANKTYYYKLKATVKGVTATSEAQSFVTDSALPRFIDCDGVTNMRDLGGYRVDGGVIKQGLIYRCGRLNKSDTNTIVPNITAAGIKTMRDLGIRTEVDLRETKMWDVANNMNEVGGLTDKSVIGDDINYCQCPIDVNAGVSNSVNYASIKKAFSHFADANNYPMIFHCTIGTDRTGFIAYLLNGLLGVSKELLLRDYLFSDFGDINATRSVDDIKGLYVDMLDNQAGDTLSEKIENYLVGTVGVPQSDINAIKSILIEGHEYTQTVIAQATCKQQGCILHTCTGDDSLSYYEYTGYGDHDYEEIAGEGRLRCKVCGKEIADGTLPTSYTAVGYIESSGTQYIDTGFSPNSKTQVVAVIDMPFISDGKSHNAFAVRGTTDGNAKEYGFLSNGTNYVSRYGNDVYLTVAYSGKMTVDMNKNVLKINGDVVYAHSEKTFDCGGYNMYIFGCNRAGNLYSPASMKLYSFEVYDDGEQIRSFTPCYRNADNVVGLYDVLNGVFYTNKGTGEFTYGNV